MNGRLRILTLTACLLAAPAALAAPKLDMLLARLHLAGDGAEAARIAKAARKQWVAQGPYSARLLLLQAGRAEAAGYAETAADLRDLVVAQWPDYAFGWYRRALARFADGDMAGALADLDRALALQPLYFDALVAKGRVLLAMKRHGKAADAFSQALIIWPGMKAAKAGLKRARGRLGRRVRLLTMPRK
ncbi:MAG TPA: hypothetical protein ENK15_02840 [Thermopetrobacter sp.]|nr:hypothetical protein [Thermopetrobacter sp.]